MVLEEVGAKVILESNNKTFGQIDFSPKQSFDVVLTNYGDAKRLVIKATKETCGLSLKEAKSVVDSCPVKLKHSVGLEDAVTIKMALEKVGAKVEIV
jgi:large subunit ribosomal protein L7/L12